jgi:hypothetical protein
VKRRFQGLAATARTNAEVPDGVFLVRVDQARYCRERQKPFYSLRLTVVAPEPLAGRTFAGRLYCSPKALWTLSWFLRDFGYDPDLLGRDEIEDKSLVGLQGVIKISHVVVNGRTVANLDAFAPTSAWDSISSPRPFPTQSEVAS